MQITKNFTAEEIECPCCHGMVFEQTMIDRAQILRTLMNIPFYVNSGYRCRFHNEAIGGSKDSQHLTGRALDIKSIGWTGRQKWQFVHEAMKLGMSVGIYKDFFHVDLRIGNPVMFYGK